MTTESLNNRPTADYDAVLQELHDLRDHLVSLEQASNSSEEINHLRSHLDAVEERLAHIMHVYSLKGELNLLSDITTLLARAVQLEDVLNAIIDGLQKLIDYNAAGIFICSRTEGTVRSMVHRGYSENRLDDLLLKVNEGIIGWVINHAEPVIAGDVSKDERYISARSRTKSEMAVPIISGDSVIGCINVEADRLNAFNVTNLYLVQDLAAQAAVALERSRDHSRLVAAGEMERELQIARQIQQSLLPNEPPGFEGYDIAGLNDFSFDIGGDYYDFIPIDQDNLGIVIADVEGKGVAAGLVMAGFRAAIRSRVELTYSIKHIFSSINKFLYDSTGPEKFVTAFYGVLNRISNQFTYVNGGHPAPVLMKPDGTHVRLTEGGPLMGILSKIEYQEATVEFEQGDTLVLFTDGIPEAGGATGEEFSEERIIEIMKRHPNLDAEKLIRAIEKEAIDWNNEKQGAGDDRTIVAVRKL